MKIISDILRIFIKDSEKYAKIKATNEQSVYFGIVGIIYPVLGLVLGGAAVFFSFQIFGGIGGSNNVLVAIFMVIVGAALGLGGVVGCFVYLIRGIISAVYQMKMPRKAIGVVALIFNILLLATGIIVAYLLLK